MQDSSVNSDFVDKVIYFNNAASTYPKSSLSLKCYNDAVHRLPTGNRFGSLDGIDECRYQLAKILELESQNVHFFPGATHAISQAIFGALKNGDHCVVDNRSHTSVMRSLTSRGFDFDICNIYSLEEHCDIDRLLSSIKKNTKLICLNAVSNVTGTIYDISQIIGAVRSRFDRVKVFVDASQAVGACEMPYMSDADLVVFSGHKHLHSVPGAAVLLAFEKMNPLVVGGTGSDSGEYDVSIIGKYTLEYGTQNYPAIYSLTESLKDFYVNKDEYISKEKSLHRYLMKKLKSINAFKILPCEKVENSVSIVSVETVIGTPEIEWAPVLKSAGIYVRGGLHCSPCIHMQHGLTSKGSLRFSLSRYNTFNEIDEAFGVLEDLCNSYGMLYSG